MHPAPSPPIHGSLISSALVIPWPVGSRGTFSLYGVASLDAFASLFRNFGKDENDPSFNWFATFVLHHQSIVALIDHE